MKVLAYTTAPLGCGWFKQAALGSDPSPESASRSGHLA